MARWRSAGWRLEGAQSGFAHQRVQFEHVLRRTTFGPFPGRTEMALDLHSSVEDLMEAQLAAEPLPFNPVIPDPSLPEGGRIDPTDPPPDSDLRYYTSFRRWWPLRLMDDDAGVHDRMTWFWHTHFTSSFVKVDSTEMCWHQMAVLDRHATGNFGDLLADIIPDRAMLRYLDGDGSSPASPNENFARELMELFTLGVDHYDQSDVESSARVLAGWRIDETSRLHREPGASPLDAPVEYLGRSVRSDEDVVAAILDHPMCAPFVVQKLWRYWIGGKPDRNAVERWAEEFRASDYEIQPLVAAILRSDHFLGSRGRRARTPIEWYCAVLRATAAPEPPTADLQSLGQSPYDPPTPAGWPGDEAWLSATQLHSKTRFLSTLEIRPSEALLEGTNLVATVVHHCGTSDISEAELAVLEDLSQNLAGDTSVDGPTRVATLMSALFLSPVFSLA